MNFNTSKTDRWQTEPSRSHVNWVVLDSDWEAEFTEVYAIQSGLRDKVAAEVEKVLSPFDGGRIPVTAP